MKKNKKKTKKFKNPVAKFMGQFNKPATHRSIKDYSRNKKHKNRDEDQD